MYRHIAITRIYIYRFEEEIIRFRDNKGYISIQSALQVRMLQNNDREMMDKLQSSLAKYNSALEKSVRFFHWELSIQAEHWQLREALADKTK